jgi:hypothetical protein
MTLPPKPRAHLVERAIEVLGGSEALTRNLPPATANPPSATPAEAPPAPRILAEPDVVEAVDTPPAAMSVEPGEGLIST